MKDEDNSAFERQAAKVLKGISRGEQALAEGKRISHEEAKDRLSKWLKSDN